MAYNDLGGLGPKQGAAVPYSWVAPSLLPQVLPWLAILALLMLKPNRCASAWWIWLPLGCVAGVTAVPESLLESLSFPQAGVFLEMIGAVAFGLAAVWLLASYVAWKHRILSFLGMLFVQGIFGLLALALKLSWEGGGLEALGLGVFVAVGVGIISIGLTLAGLVCRGRYGWLRLSLWLIAMLAGLWLLLIGPVFIFDMVVNGGGVSPFALFPAVLSVTGLTFGVMLPFLVLSFTSRFYRERLKGLLHLGGTAPPPVMSPPAPAVPEPARG